MSFETWLKKQKLNPHQESAVLEPGDLGIRAAAGSGKTKTLVCRILAILDRLRGKSQEIGGDLVNRASLSRIAATTFTRKAAGEMRERLHQYLEELISEDRENQAFWVDRLEELPTAFLGTMDSLAAAMVRQLNRAGCVSPLGSDFVLMDDLDRETLIEQATRLTRLECAHVPGNPWLVWETEVGRREVTDSLCDFLSRGIDWETLKPDPADGPFTQAMIEVIRVAGKIHFDLCQKEGTFDFGQVSRELLRLLQNHENPRQRILAHFEHLLIDEFQDTNDQQWRILTALAGQPGQGRITFVGDPQQSIYAFRGADPGVFERTWDLFQASGCRLIRLEENYRTLSPEPMATMNLFSQTAFSQAYGQSFSFVPLQAGLKADQGGQCGLILGEQGDDWCDFVAAELLNRLGKPWFDHRKNEQKPLRFSDMAVLLRSRARLGVLQKALDRWGVPYQMPGGIGFWQTQEIKDITNLVKALADEGDDLALVGVMRGPLGRLSDSVILSLSAAPGFGFTQKLLGLLENEERDWNPKPPPGDFANLKAFARLWHSWRKQVDRLPHVDLILGCLEQTGAWHFFAAMDQGRRVVANLEKGTELLLDWTQTHPGSLAQLARRMDQAVRNATRSEQADPPDQIDAVEIMTIHAAKGLERPLVVLGDIQNRGSNQGDSWLVLDRYLHFDDPQSGLADEWHGTLVRKDSPSLDPLQTRLDKARQGELARLFYVGLTRAQDTLLLAGQWKPQSKPAKHSFAFWLAAAVGYDVDQPLDRASFLEPPRLIPGFPLLEPPKVNRGIPGEIPLPDQSIADPVKAFPENPVLAMSLIEELARLWNQDRALWRLRFLHFVKPQLSREIPGNPPVDEEGVSFAPGKRVGSLIHRTLELGMALHSLPQEVAMEELGAVQMGMAEPDEDPLIAAEIAREAWEVIQGWQGPPGGSIQRLIEAPGQSEVDLVLPLGRWRLSGRIDKLLDEKENGGQVFLDWKTDSLPPEKIEAKYTTVMGLYALALAKTGARMPQRVTAHLVCLRHNAIRTLVFEKARLVALEKEWTDLFKDWIEDRESGGQS